MYIKNYYYLQLKQLYLAKSITGFTLPELVITIAISGILLSVGVPSFSAAIKDNRQTTLFNDLTSILLYTKSQAVTQKKFVTLCPRNTEGNNCGGSASWNDGWIAFVDSGMAGTLDGNDTLLKVHEPIHSDINIIANTLSITIDNRGLIKNGIATPVITVCDSRGTEFQRTKILSRTIKLKDSNSHLTCGS